MRKISAVLMLVLLSAPVFSETIWGSQYGAGNFILGADAGVELYGGSIQLAVYPDAEVIVYKPEFGDLAFIDIGVAARGRIGIPLTLSTGLSAGVGAFGTVHFGLRGLDIITEDYLDRLDIYAQLGVSFDILKPTWQSMIGFASKSGINYFLTENLAVGLSYTSWNVFSGGAASVSLRFGNRPEVKGLEVDFSGIETIAIQPYLLQFYTVYYSALYTGGGYWYDDKSYDKGEGVVYRVRVSDDGDTDGYYVEHALADVRGGNRIWKLRYRDDDDSILYEYEADSEGMIKVIYVKTEDGEILKMKPDDDTYISYGHVVYEDGDLEIEKLENQVVETEAGRFKSTAYSFDNSPEEGKGYWWISEQVPGRMVKYIAEDSESKLESVLVEITRGNVPELIK